MNLYTKINHTSTTEVPRNSEGVSVPVGKAITAIVMFITVLVAIYSPILIFHKLNIGKRSSCQDKIKLWIGRMSCFAAGVFLSTGFMDIFPDVIRSLNEATKKLNIKSSFPLASFFALLGFFLVLSIEQIILIYKNHLAKTYPTLSKDKRGVGQVNDAESQDSFLPNISVSNDTEIWSEDLSNTMQFTTCNNSRSINHEHSDHDHVMNTEDNPDEHANIFHHNTSRIFALMFAMSFHSVFEGLAIGLGSTVAGVTQLFVALSLHKLIIAGSLGLNLATSQLHIWIKIVVSLIFAIASPVGIGIGMLIILQEKGHDTYYLVGGILEGVACGTFLYVVFFEILPHELSHSSHEDRGGKLTCVLLGFIVVCIYLLLIPLA